MFEEMIRKSVEYEREAIKTLQKALDVAENDFMVLYWHDEIRKHEYAIDILNGVLNLVSLNSIKV